MPRRAVWVAILSAAIVLVSAYGGRANTAAPRVVLSRLIAAATAGNAAGMWTTLSAETRRRLGPTLLDFRRRSAGPLRRQLAGVAHGPLHVFLEERVTPDLAVAAISATRNRLAVYAAAFRRERGGWRIAIDPSLHIKPTLPRPNRRVFQRTKVLAEIAARAPVSGASLWFDGVPFAAEGATTDPEHAGLLGEAPQPLRSGPHTVVAFATAGHDIAALAWAFTSYGGPYRP